MEHIPRVLRETERDCSKGEITKEFVDTFIDRIIVTPEDGGDIHLAVKIFTDVSCERYLQRLK